MKSEHRHELAENDLAKLITRGLKKIEPYQNQILGAMVVITVLVVAVVIMTRSSSTGRSEGFAELLNCKTADDYLNVAETYEGKPAGHWARLRAGEEFLHEGIRLSISDRAQAVDRLEEAEESYDKLLQDSSVSGELRVKALYGMAMTLESLGNDTERAIQAYEALLNAPGGSRYRPIAEDRIEELKTGRGQAFYAWFVAQNPSPQDRPLPRDFPEDPFRGMFDDDPEPGSLPPPPPETQHYTPEAAAPEPPGETEEDDRPALSAPGATEGEGAAPEESSESTTEPEPDGTEE